jgi:lysozyme family protein
MQHPYPLLAPEYASLLAAMRVDPGRAHQLTARAEEILALAQQHRSEWDAVEAATGVPRLWGIASFERESSSDYARSPAQGDRWDRTSTDIPRGRGPFKSWGDACVDAYRIDHLDQVRQWTWTRACYEGELYNGFGPRNHGRRTGYLWAWTNIYDGGKYVGDNDWNPDAEDGQCGMVPMMAALLMLDASLRLDDEFPPLTQVPEPLAAGTTTALQKALNRAGASPPIAVDGSYGRETRRAVVAFQTAHGLEVDGIAGPETWGAIDRVTAAAETAGTAS